MMYDLRRRLFDGCLWIWAIVGTVLPAAAYFGSRAFARWLGLLVVGTGVVLLLQRPVLGLLVLVKEGSATE